MFESTIVAYKANKENLGNENQSIKINEKLRSARKDLASTIEGQFKDKFSDDKIMHLCNQFKGVKSIEKFQRIISSVVVSDIVREMKDVKLSHLRIIYKNNIKLFDKEYEMRHSGHVCKTKIYYKEISCDSSGNYIFTAGIGDRVMSAQLGSVYGIFRDSFMKELKFIVEKENVIKCSLKEKISKKDNKYTELFSEECLKELSGELLLINESCRGKFMKILFSSMVLEGLHSHKEYNPVYLLYFFKENRRFFNKDYDVEDDKRFSGSCFAGLHQEKIYNIKYDEANDVDNNQEIYKKFIGKIEKRIEVFNEESYEDFMRNGKILTFHDYIQLPSSKETGAQKGN